MKRTALFYRSLPIVAVLCAVASAALVASPRQDAHVFLPLVSAPAAHNPTTVSTTTISIPTHPYEQALYNIYAPAFNLTYPRIDRSLYDDSIIENRTYTLLLLENEYLRLSIMPQLGGRIYQVVDRTSGNRLFYQNPVIKPSAWGPSEMGWWLAVGGIEWCFPVEEHGYEWGIPWGYAIVRNANGVTVTLWDTLATDRVRARVALTLRDDEALFEIAPTIENPTTHDLDVKFWLNAMAAPGMANHPSEDTRLIWPATAATVHSTGDSRLPGAGEALSWPLYNGVDWSRLGNLRQWAGFFQRPQSGGGFQAVYDEGSDAGVIRSYDEAAGAVTGAKFFGFGWANPIPPSNYTDDSSAYVEMHGGIAPTFADARHLSAGQSITWEERWYPAAHLGGLTWANGNVALRLDAANGSVNLAVAANRKVSDARIVLLRRGDGHVLWDSHAALGPGQNVQAGPIDAGGLSKDEIGVVVLDGATPIAVYQYIGSIPPPIGTPTATPMPSPTGSPPANHWSGSVVGLSPSPTGIVRVWVQGQAGLTVTLRTANNGWSATNFVGTKPEYGPDALEFAPIGPGAYVIEPMRLGVSVPFTLPESSLAEIVFARH